MRFLILPLLLSPVAFGATTSIVFDSSYDLNRDFRTTTNAGFLTALNDSGNTYIRHTGLNTQSAFVYDTNGAAAGNTTFTVAIGDSLSVSTNVRFTGSPDPGNNSSFGFIFGGSTASHLALVNFNQSTLNELLRTFTGSDLFGNAGTADATTLGGFNAISLNTFATVTATYTALSATQYKIGIAVGSNVLETTYNAAPLTNIQIGLRLNNAGSDRFTDINIVPEPASAGLAALGLMPLFLRRRISR